MSSKHNKYSSSTRSDSEGFVTHSKPNAGIVVESRTLSERERKALDVGDFFSKPKQ